MSSILVIAGSVTIGCSSDPANENPDGSPDSDADSDSDSDTDSDADSDSDTDTDADSDSDSDGDADGGPDGGADSLNVLFIGNSYTAVNDLPTMFEAVCASVSYGPEVSVNSVTGGGLLLEDHLSNPTTVALISGGGWTHVVLQEQSYVSILWPDTFYDAADSLADLVDGVGAVTVWFETWAREEGNTLYDTDLDGYDPISMQAALRDRYSTAATSYGGVMAPVGDAWEACISSHPEIDLFSTDGSHPSSAGTYLAAAVFAEVIAKVDAEDIGFSPTGLAPSDGASIRQIAHDAVSP